MVTKTRERVQLGLVNSSTTLDIEKELAEVEARERKRLGLDKSHEQWQEKNSNAFTTEERTTTTLLIAGLTHAHEQFVQAGLTAAGFRVQALDCPDNESLWSTTPTTCPGVPSHR